jgi:hypothetical protein
MHRARPLPAHRVQRFHGRRATSRAENKAWLRRLATEGQHPRAMVIACCDSRVHGTSIFGADAGSFFIMCRGTAPDLEERSRFVGRWMDILPRPFPRVGHRRRWANGCARRRRRRSSSRRATL